MVVWNVAICCHEVTRLNMKLMERLVVEVLFKYCLKILKCNSDFSLGIQNILDVAIGHASVIPGSSSQPWASRLDAEEGHSWVFSC